MYWMLLNSHLHAQRRSFLYWLRLHNIKVGTQISHYYYYWMTCSKRERCVVVNFLFVSICKETFFISTNAIPGLLHKNRSQPLLIAIYVNHSCFLFENGMFIPACDLVILCNHGDIVHKHAPMQPA